MVPFSSILASIAGFVILDGLWLGLLMRSFYVRQFAAIGRFRDGALAPVWSVAALVYVLLGLGVAVFVVPRAHSTVSAAAFGALFGLVVYGVYDLTNYATLAQWPSVVTVADIVWGTCACAAIAAVVFVFASR